MRKQLIIVGIIILLITVGLSGCNEQKSEDNETDLTQQFLGTWEINSSNITSSFTLFSNGSCDATPDVVDGHISLCDRWGIKNNKLVFYFPDSDTIIESYSFLFSNNYNTLNLTRDDYGDPFGASNYVYIKK